MPFREPIPQSEEVRGINFLTIYEKGDIGIEREGGSFTFEIDGKTYQVDILPARSGSREGEKKTAGGAGAITITRECEITLPNGEKVMAVIRFPGNINNEDIMKNFFAERDWLLKLNAAEEIPRNLPFDQRLDKIRQTADQRRVIGYLGGGTIKVGDKEIPFQLHELAEEELPLQIQKEFPPGIEQRYMAVLALLETTEVMEQLHKLKGTFLDFKPPEKADKIRGKIVKKGRIPTIENFKIIDFNLTGEATEENKRKDLQFLIGHLVYLLVRSLQPYKDFVENGKILWGETKEAIGDQLPEEVKNTLYDFEWFFLGLLLKGQIDSLETLKDTLENYKQILELLLKLESNELTLEQVLRRLADKSFRDYINWEVHGKYREKDPEVLLLLPLAGIELIEKKAKKDKADFESIENRFEEIIEGVEEKINKVWQVAVARLRIDIMTDFIVDWVEKAEEVVRKYPRPDIKAQIDNILTAVEFSNATLRFEHATGIKMPDRRQVMEELSEPLKISDRKSLLESLERKTQAAKGLIKRYEAALEEKALPEEKQEQAQTWLGLMKKVLDVWEKRKKVVEFAGKAKAEPAIEDDDFESYMEYAQYIEAILMAKEIQEEGIGKLMSSSYPLENLNKFIKTLEEKISDLIAGITRGRVSVKSYQQNILADVVKKIADMTSNEELKYLAEELRTASKKEDQATQEELARMQKELADVKAKLATVQERLKRDEELFQTMLDFLKEHLLNTDYEQLLKLLEKIENPS